MDRKYVSGRKLILGMAGTAVFAAAHLLTSPQSFADGSVMAGKVVSVEGNVLMRQDGTAGGKAQVMRAGAIIKEGDVINTASDGKAKIMLEDKTIRRVIVPPRGGLVNIVVV